jgi:sec-independent protein translocase protein TatC
MARVRPVSHDDRPTLVEHLDELRTRIIIAVAAFVVGTALCAWQNQEIFDLLNRPLPEGRHPVTLGVTEPFFTTLTVSAYAGLMLALPVILYQAYAFLLPAFSPGEKRVVLPLMLLAPLLFIGGVAFGYVVVLDRAVDFLLNFNDQQFNIQVRAREYYTFVVLTLVAMGLVFQVPLAILAITRLGIMSPAQLRASRRYSYLGIAVLAALLPTVDPVTMLIEMVPLIVLFELSIVLAALLGRPPGEPAPSESRAEGSP